MDQNHNKFNPPSGPPPDYPQQPTQAMQHYDAGPYQNQWQQPQGQGPWQEDRGQWQQYGGPGQYGPPQGGYYGPPQQGMQYQQPGMPPQGYYVDQRRGPGAGEGCCAALLGALACCCCLDLLF